MIRRLRWIGMGVLAAVMAAVPATAAVNSGKLSFSLGTDATTAYFFRGILQERDGVIIQPYGEMGVNLYENEGAPISSISLTGGLWASAHSALTGASGAGPRAFYELDVYGGANVGLFDVLDAGVSYVLYTSPNGGFSNIQEVDFSLGLDDSKWLGAMALNPYVLFALEVDNGADLGSNQGTYAEIGINPSFEVIPGDRYPVTLSLPMLAGFSVNDYFQNANNNDETWGYARFGALLSVPLPFIPEEYGSWSATGGAYLYTFNSNLQKINQGNDPWVVGTWGISMSY